MNEAQSFIAPSSLSESKQKMLQMEEAKIKTLEGRLMGPSSDGNLPVDYEPLQKSEIEHLKCKILFNEQSLSQQEPQKSNQSIIIQNKEKDLSSTSLTKKGEKIDALNYLMNKRQRDTSKPSKSESQNNSQLSQDNKDNEIVESENFIFLRRLLEGGKNKKIKDYYNNPISTPLKISGNTDGDTIPYKNHFTAPQMKRIKSENTIDSNLSNSDPIALKKYAEEKKKELIEKDREIAKTRLKLSEMEESNKILIDSNKKINEEVIKCRNDISYFVKEVEELKRLIKRKSLHDQQYRLGRKGYQKLNQGKDLEFWEDGEEYRILRRKFEDIRLEKDEVEKQKRRLSAYKAKFNKQNTNLGGLDVIDNGNEDMKDLLSFRWNTLQREEQEIKEKKDKLDQEKAIHIQELHLFNEETHCTFVRKHESLPLLANRYQIISLLGKGGYSEVYKAYDLDNHMYVACKLHQLNPTWKEEVKDNYIKHTIRENQIHKEIDHSKVVKHFDTIEIDNNSFCTVLEYCSGPDLANYLYRNKVIQEKEARIIITQILLGLEYLNKLPNKIIHYDLKPQNIIFHNMEVKISDFGLSKIIEPNKDKVQLTSQGVGTYWYLPPECFEDKNVDINSKVDIWSCGVILYEIFFRKKPFGENFTQEKILKERVMLNAKKVDFPAKPVISEDCKDFIRNCLAFRPEDRYDVFDALESPFLKPEKNKK